MEKRIMMTHAEKEENMSNKRIGFFLLLITFLVGNLFAGENIGFTLEVTGISANQGHVHVKIYSTDRDYRNDIPYASYTIESNNQLIIHTFDIIEGEYLIALFQDTNNNGVLDTNFLGFPREPVGLSNYTSGIPGGFNRHKIQINNNSNRILINIRRI